MINGLDLFSGIGGLSVALKEYVRPIAYCELDRFCQGVLMSRMGDGDIPLAPIWDDIRTLEPWFLPCVDIIYGGFPCQDISVAGAGKGLEGERSGLFFEIVRLCSEIKPRFIFLENVPAICSRGGAEVVRKITEMGYDCRWCIISAASVGALHRRERWFLLAHSKHDGASSSKNGGSVRTEHVPRYNEQKKNGGKVERTSSLPFHVADSESKGLEGQWIGTFSNKSKQPELASHGEALAECRCEPKWPAMHFAHCDKFWKIEPELGRVVDGVQLRMDKLKSLGNAVVPRQAKEAFEILLGIK